MAVKKAAEKSSEILVVDIQQGSTEFGIVGNSPMIFNRMAEKGKRELLMPKGRKTLAERAANLKHMPIDEYRNSVYRNLDDKAPTRLCFPSPGFKGAMATAALDLPGTKKTQIGRLTWVPGTHINIWGVPQLLMSVVRSADIAKTPDIRTRAIVPEWCCLVTVNFIKPQLTALVVGKLLSAAGLTVGVGDFRQEKGKGSFGQFRICQTNDPEFKRIMKAGGRVAQDKALETPKCFDYDSEELFAWFNEELEKLREKPSGAKFEVPVDVDVEEEVD